MADAPYRGRFAPSPTGALHLGNARTALAAWLRARSERGRFVLRIEDLDSARSRDEHVTGNADELRWLGLDWDEGPDVGGPFGPYRQSQRHDRYGAALAQLEASGRLFPCWLSRRDLRDLASAPHDVAPAYGPTEREANEALRSRKIAEGKAPSLRLRAEPGTLRLHDAVAGERSFDAESDVGDTVVRRADDEWAYALAVAVDDADMEITEVLRGDDLLAPTAAQLLVYRALDLAPPRFAHIPLLQDASGERMAKRRGSATLAALRDDGADPRRVVGALAGAPARWSDALDGFARA